MKHIGKYTPVIGLAILALVLFFANYALAITAQEAKVISSKHRAIEQKAALRSLKYNIETQIKENAETGMFFTAVQVPFILDEKSLVPLIADLTSQGYWVKLNTDYVGKYLEISWK